MAQLQASDPASSRFLAAAKVIDISWAIPGLGLLKEAANLFAESAAQMDKRQLNSLLDSLENKDRLVAVAFPDKESRRRLMENFFTVNEIVSQITESLPAYQYQSANSLFVSSVPQRTASGNA